ncbi:MAG: bacteriohemerythrin [Candidatus Caldatribacterium sp.]|uniref:bacteriohemerythrin n=1 Tax=Candidatus Caldatribacterium sp. TaxID=2282143 RepID=UPI002993C7DF|nr:bacteriohemerythrin [Candidatus Caldatribacterium sp.]MCX7730974.1 bacteriohemerythrin [Candidatus Caldatribacterium sp.]MDW8081054.1 bacteriohemerythrin [Candidatus Calescibacterium sp.]
MLEWSDRFSIGVPEIDAQHQELFRQVNRLLEACMQGGGKTLLPEIFDFLGRYAVEHFATEERYMTQYKYPKLPEHKKVHEGFVQTFLDFRKKAEAEGPGVNLVVQVNRTLVDWLKNHILGMDQEMGKFLQEAMRKK